MFGSKRILVATLILIFCVVIPAGAAVSIGAASMMFKSKAALHDDNGCVVWDGYIGTLIKMDKPGIVTVTVKADGQMARRVLPIMHLHIADQREVFNVEDHGGAHTTYSDYTAKFNLPAGVHWVRVELANDIFKPPVDRNIFLKSITFSGAPVEVLNTPTNENILAAADSYIKNYRRGQAAVTLEGLPKGTTVQVKLKNHAFNFGAAVFGYKPEHASWTKPNVPEGSNDYKYAQFIKSHFNMIVPENAGKWELNEAMRDVPDMSLVDSMLDFAERNGISVRMHTVFWGAQQPGWVQRLEQQALRDQKAYDELWDEIMERIDYVVTRRAGRYVELDGINESVHQPIYGEVFEIEGEAKIYKMIAEASAGRARVYVNEFNVLNNPMDPYSNWYKGHIQSLLDEGAQIDGIGIQCHTTGAEHDPIMIFRNLQHMSGFERPMTLTEFSSDDKNPAKVMTETMRLMFGNDQATGFMMWGFWKANTWRQGYALVDENWNLTDAGKAYEKLMAEWTNDETLKVDDKGQVSFTGFYGDYDVTIAGKTYPLTLKKGTVNCRISIK